MVTGRKRILVLAVSALVATAGLGAVAAAGGADDTPVRAAAPTTGSADAPDSTDAAADETTAEDEQATTSTAPETTTSTTAPPTTTTTAPPAPVAEAVSVPAPVATAPAPPAPTTTAAPAPPPPPPPPSTPAHGVRSGECERYMADQINAARGRAGRPALAFDTVIQYIAVAWSDGMAGRQVLSHNPDYADQILRHRDYRTAGENVGRGYDLGSLFQAFMDSPAHRANIEHSAYSHVTVGCLTDGSGQFWVTQNFWG